MKKNHTNRIEEVAPYLTGIGTVSGFAFGQLALLVRTPNGNLLCDCNPLLDDVYAFEAYLQAKHSENHNVKAKIRQQLQFLRDKGVIEFVGRGRYRMKYANEKTLG